MKITKILSFLVFSFILFSSFSLRVHAVSSPPVTVTTTTTTTSTIGTSSINIYITDDDYSISLREFSNSFLVDESFYKDVRNLYIDVVTSQSYTIQMFRDSFCVLLNKYCLSVTDEMLQYIDDYAVNYLSDYLVSDTSPYLLYLSSTHTQVVIGVTLVLLIFIMGGIKY